ncbi:MAG: hypothetical protein WC766_01420 [Patescibacteria group bacterium]|jgi:hypothetical protein
MFGHLIYSYNHLDDARIQQEISRSLYSTKFNGVKVVHAHNGKASFGYKKYLEDVLIKRRNLGHFEGAADLIDSGMDWFIKNKIKSLRYVMVTAADTWCLNVNWIEGLIKEMEAKGQVVACSSWGHVKAPEKPTGFSTDFFIVDLEWARASKVFPLNYKKFKNSFQDVFLLNWSLPIVEACFQYRYARYFMQVYKDNDVWMNRNKFWRRISEREPVHVNGDRFSDWPKIGLYTSPEPLTKQKALKALKINLGKYSDKLLKAKDLSYYNNHK